MALVPGMTTDTPCADCLHDRAEHMHYRLGTECVAAGCSCVRFRLGFIGWLRWISEHQQQENFRA